MTRYPIHAGIVGVTAIAAAAISLTASAQDSINPLPGLRPTPPRTGEQLVRVRGYADTPTVTANQTFHLAFVFDIEPHWHIYWKNPGASGGPTHITITAPEGYVIGKTLFPRPRAFEGEEGTTFGYEDQVVLFVEVTAPSSVTFGTASFAAQINWMVCKDVCLLGKSTQTLQVPVVDREAPAMPTLAHSIPAAVTEFKARLPKPLKDLKDATATFDGKVLTIVVPDSAAATLEFFPVEMPGVTYDSSTLAREQGMLKLIVPVNVRPNDALGEPIRIEGTLGLNDRQTDPSYDIEIPLPAT